MGHLRVFVTDSWLQAKKTTWETRGWSYNRKQAKNVAAKQNMFKNNNNNTTMNINYYY